MMPVSYKDRFTELKKAYDECVRDNEGAIKAAEKTEIRIQMIDEKITMFETVIDRLRRKNMSLVDLLKESAQTNESLITEAEIQNRTLTAMLRSFMFSYIPDSDEEDRSHSSFIDDSKITGMIDLQTVYRFFRHLSKTVFVTGRKFSIPNNITTDGIESWIDPTYVPREQNEMTGKDIL